MSQLLNVLEPIQHAHGLPNACYINDDMYVCPGWDAPLAKAIDETPHNFFFFSSTAIELKAQSNCSIEYDFGKDITSFQESDLLSKYASLPMQDWQGATWPPNIVHVDTWDAVGGYSNELARACTPILIFL